MNKVMYSMISGRTMTLLGALLTMVVSAQSFAADAPAGTLDRIRSSHVLKIGVREDNLPFAGYRQGVASGYSIELCDKVADQLRKELKLSDMRVQYVVVTAADRMAKVKNGEADIECGTTVNTQTRAKDVDFSYAHFISGTRFMSRKSASLNDYTQLAQQPVGVVKGTTAEKLFSQLNEGTLKTMKLVVYPKNQDAMKALESGAVVAVAQLDILLEGMRIQSSQPDQYVISAKPLSIEPMTLMVRKDDEAFRAVVDKTLANLYASGEIKPIYDRWFKTATLNMPIPLMLSECFRRPCRSQAAALGLGYEL